MYFLDRALLLPGVFFVILVFMHLFTCMGLACLYLLLLFLSVVMDSTRLPDRFIEPDYDNVCISCWLVVLFHILVFVLFEWKGRSLCFVAERWQCRGLGE